MIKKRVLVLKKKETKWAFKRMSGPKEVQIRQGKTGGARQFQLGLRLGWGERAQPGFTSFV